MITVTIPRVELYNEESNSFYVIQGGEYKFEHSLKAIAKWEAKHKIPFLNTTLTNSQLLDYFICMCEDMQLHISQLNNDVVSKLSDYMSDQHTATKIYNLNKEDNNAKSKVMTSESIYAMMTIAGVPFSCEDWNINNLLMLLKVIAIESGAKTKMSTSDIYKQNTELNAQRRAMLNNKG